MFTRPEYLQGGTPLIHLGRGINSESHGASYCGLMAVVLVSSVLLTKVHAFMIIMYYTNSLNARHEKSVITLPKGQTLQPTCVLRLKMLLLA